MAIVDHEPRAAAAAHVERTLAGLLPEDEPLLAWAIGLADAEPWRKVAVAVTPARTVWVDLASGAAVLVTHDAVDRAHFHSYEAPPWPVYLDLEVRADGGTVTLVPAQGDRSEVRGRLRASALHRALDTVRLACDDACALELALRDARDRT